MEYVLTLVGNPLAAAQVARARDALAGAGPAATLAEGRAVDIPFDGMAPEEAERRVRAALGRAPVDLLAQPVTGRRKRLLVADMDSTIITVECIDELADFLDLKPAIAAITERAMRGEIDFAAALRERAAMLRGLPVETMQRCYDERVRLMPGARTLVMTMRAHGAHTALVSGGFDFFTGRVRALAGFHEDHANRLETADGRLSGRVAEPILGADAKLEQLRRLTAALDLPAAATLAVGDGANDLKMIAAAGLGAAFRAKPIVAAAARARIDHDDLNALLYFQGYRSDEMTA